MNRSPEHELRQEAERYAPAIRLEFLRHDEKEKETTSGAREGDRHVRLTQKGREHSTEAGKTKSPHPEVGLVYGSPRERSTEAALRQLFANESGITPEDSLEDMGAKIGERVKVGKKNIETSNLDFTSRESGEFHDALYEHYLGPTKDALVFLREESDALMKKTGDLETTSYSRAAGNVAELVQKYLGVLPRWERLAAEKPEEYAKYDNELQRFFGSHQTAIEPFLMKAIEKSEGPDGVEKFLESLPNKNGFGFGEGFSAKISRGENGEPVVGVRYGNREWDLAPEIIDEIVRERDELNEEITKKKNENAKR